MDRLNDEADFDRWAPTYDRDVREDGLFPFDGYDRVLQYVVEQAAVMPGAAVLELGIGTGNLSALLVAAGVNLWGVDFSAAMLELAAAKLPTAHLLQADLLNDLPAEIGRFSAITSAYVFHEFATPDKLALLARLATRHLLPGGRIVIGDIAFADDATRDRARLAAGDRWDEEYFWSDAEATAMAGQLALDLTLRPISSCATVFVFTRRD